jgi:hypothetical protein
MSPGPGSRHRKTPIRKPSSNENIQHLLDVTGNPGDQPNPVTLYLSGEPPADAPTENNINPHLAQSICPKRQGKARPVLLFQGNHDATATDLKDQNPFAGVKDR